jgi:DNA-binding CsgD family transcriptional regulator
MGNNLAGSSFLSDGLKRRYGIHIYSKNPFFHLGFEEWLARDNIRGATYTGLYILDISHRLVATGYLPAEIIDASASDPLFALVTAPVMFDLPEKILHLLARPKTFFFALSHRQRLNAREEETLRFLLALHTPAHIAALQGVSTNTVSGYRNNALCKLGVNNLATLHEVFFRWQYFMQEICLNTFNVKHEVVKV